jgi:hypothetical protein
LRPPLALEECGSHAVTAASFRPCRVDERALLTDVLPALEPGMLVIVDRNFYSFQLWRKALDTGADLLWRVQASVTLPVIEALPDGSYRSMVINPKIIGSTALHVGGGGVVWELQGDGSAGEHDGGQCGLGTVEAVGAADDQAYLVVQSFLAAV